jgi:hypothetical protein
MRKISKKGLEKKLDKAWSKAVLSKGKCEVCGLREHLNAHHIEGRRNLRLRWDLQNGVCLCSGCHVFRKESAHQSPEWFHFFLEENRWEDLQYIMCVRNEIKKWSIEELEIKLNELLK